MICKTGISRVVLALAVCTVVAGASAQSQSSSFGLRQPAEGSLFGHAGLGFAATDGRSVESGFSTARRQVYLLEADRPSMGTDLFAARPATAADWGDRIESANMYSLSGQDDGHNHANMEMIYIVGGAVIVAAILLLVLS